MRQEFLKKNLVFWSQFVKLYFGFNKLNIGGRDVKEVTFCNYGTGMFSGFGHGPSSAS